LKEIINKVYNKVGIKSNRTKNITKHVFISFIYRGGNIITTFLMVPLTIKFLDTENYGIWLTLSSFIAWFSFFDIGLGNGLRNKFAEAKAKGDLKLAKAYVSSAYFTIGSICLFLIAVFLILNLFTDWTRVFNTNPSFNKELGLLMPIVFSFFCLQLVVKLIATIYTADQNHSMPGKINFYTSVFSLLAIWLMTHIFKGSLLLFGVIFTGLPVFIMLFFNLFAFSNNYNDYKPSFSLWKHIYIKDIFGLGLKFFIIQMSGIILFTSDNFIITQLYGPKEVVPYNIVYKYFSASSMVLSIIMVPYWSSITEAYIKGDFTWLKQAMKSLLKITLVSMFLLIFMLLISPEVYKIWIGDQVAIPYSLSIFTALYFAISIFYNPFTALINGTGKILLQLYSLAITSIINIPLSVFLAKNLNFGVSGVILSTVICLIPYAVLAPIQSYKIINNKATGLWNK
jgi:O-antigen/teichoic acid export membrane protein